MLIKLNNNYFNKRDFSQTNIPKISFTGHNQLTMKVLRNLKGVTCVYCGHEMLTSAQIDECARKAARLKGVPLAKYLISLQPDMKPYEKKAACLIKEELKKHPQENLQGILKLLFPKHVDKLEKQQEKVLLELQKIAVDFPEHDRAVTAEQIKKGLEGIKKRTQGEHFKRNRYINEFFGLRDKYEDFGNYMKIIEAIKSMPNTHTSIDAFIVKYSRKSPKEIMTRLLSPSQVTVEHLNPRSKGGTNILSNLVLACGRDNSTRRSNDLNTMPNLSINLPNYFRTLRKALSEKLPWQEFSKVEEYIKGVKETITGLLKNGLKISDPSKGRYY